MCLQNWDSRELLKQEGHYDLVAYCREPHTHCKHCVENVTKEAHYKQVFWRTYHPCCSVARSRQDFSALPCQAANADALFRYRNYCDHQFVKPYLINWYTNRFQTYAPPPAFLGTSRFHFGRNHWVHELQPAAALRRKGGKARKTARGTEFWCLKI